MDQPKQERMLSLLYLLAGNCNVSFKKMMERLDLSRRSLFRYFTTLREHGYDVKLNDDGFYRIPSYVPKQAVDHENIIFTHEEAVLLSHLIESLDNTNVLKPVLQGKLASVFYQETVTPYIVHPWNSKNVEVLTKAIEEHRQVFVKGYECSYKGHVKLRLSLKAKNLLVEEYPMAMDQVYRADGCWYWEGPIYGVLGAGRFVLGLCDAVELIEGDALRKWVLEMARDAGVKFTAPCHSERSEESLKTSAPARKG